MAKMGIVENGLKRRRKSRRRRNPSTATKASTAKKNPARRAVSLASAKAVAKRNGLKLVSKSVANPKRKRRRRRNGITTAAVSRRNGIFGNTKADAKTVGTVIGGAIFTKTVARIIAPFVAPYAAQVGIGNYAEIIVDGIVALLITPFVANKVVGGGSSAQNARLGGLLVVGLSAIEKVAPSVLQYNPFVTSPVVMMGNGSAGVAPAAVAQLAAGVANSSNPQAEAAKVGSVMRSLDAAGAQSISPSYQGSIGGSADMLVL